MNQLSSPCRRSTAKLITSFGAASLLALAGCGEKSSLELGSVFVKSALIKKAEGGSIEIFATEHDKIHGAKIAIPADALPADTTISIGYDPSGITDESGTAIGPVVEFAPSGTTFSSPVVITIPYDGTIERSRLKVWVKDANGLTTIPAHQLTLDETSKTVRFQITHFTEFQCGNGMPPASCDPANDCGPAPGLPTWICADGSLGGPTGNCTRNMAGDCQWEVNWCPVACTAADCGPVPELALVCADGQMAAIECNRQADGACGWDINCPNQCDPATGGTGGFMPPPNDPTHCSSACNTDMDCPMGTTCNPMTGSCITTGISCGNNVCGDGEYCCNESCGFCAPLGGTCTEQACTNACSTDPNGMNTCPPGTMCNAMTGNCDPSGNSCGNNVCGMGEYCCNESCGTCAPFGATCTQESCSACGNPMDPTNPNGTMCQPGEVCGADGTCTSICQPSDCGPMPMVPSWTCADGSLGGPTGRCLPVDMNGFMPPPGGGMAPTPGTTCAWEIVWCPMSCDVTECGPQPGQMNYTCPDGMTVGGPTGNCVRNDDGSCGWEVISCMN